MYKILGRRVALYPTIAKPESQKKDIFCGACIIALTKTDAGIKRRKETIKGASRNKARRAAKDIIKEVRPDYIAIVKLGGFRGSETIMERGDKKLVDEYLKQQTK
jgi:hypothetical protein